MFSKWPYGPALLKEISVLTLPPSLQSRRFLTKTRRYTDRGRHLEKQRKRLRGRDGEARGENGVFFPPLPLSYFKPINLSLKISFWLVPTLWWYLRTIHGSRSKIRLLCRLPTPLKINFFQPHPELSGKKKQKELKFCFLRPIWSLLKFII